MESEQSHTLVSKRVAPWIAAVVIGGAGVGYAVHEHNSAQTLATQNQQVSAQLNATEHQLDALAAKVNAMTTPPPAAPAPEAKPSAAVPSHATSRHVSARRRASAQDARFKKMQSQLDAQGKAIDDTRNDLTSARTELSGSIARTHDELVVLEKKGERNYIEFDLSKSKEFKREGPISISLRKANEKHQYADLMLIVEDRDLSQKHVNLYQPAMFYQPDSPQPVEIVINQISKNHIHGYISAPKYRQSELAVVSNSASGQDQSANPTAQAPARQKLPVPSPDQP
ncbi:MAG TPA: hypothetical protein VKR52_10710 [Terracidiphilus sp.]|nr:hypothetical protein [Terracidiphilus sp.]